MRKINAQAKVKPPLEQIKIVFARGSKDNYFISDEYISKRARQDKAAALSREIEEGRKAGFYHIKSIGEKYNHQDWRNGIKIAPHSENIKIEDAFAEWADGDSIASHIAYGNDYFCTRDEGKSAGSNSIFSERNREWLREEYGVKFVTPEEIAKKL